MNPTLSIIIPVYNVEEWLGKCLDSILAQTYTDWEAILVDDGSTDRSGEICSEYAKKDSRFLVVHQQNHGVSYARNIGITRARGAYLAFVDADDWLEPAMYSTMIPAMESVSAEMAVCDVNDVSIQKDGTYRITPRNLWGKNKTSHTVVHGADLYKEVFARTTTLWNKVFVRENVKDVRFPEDIVFGEDSIYFLEAMENITTAVITPEIRYNYYRNREGNVVSAKINLTCLQNLKNTEYIYDVLTEKGQGVIGTERIRLVVFQILEQIPYKEFEEYGKYIKACVKTARYPKKSDLRKYFLDPTYDKRLKMRYLYFFLMPKKWLKKRSKQ